MNGNNVTKFEETFDFFYKMHLLETENTIVLLAEMHNQGKTEGDDLLFHLAPIYYDMLELMRNYLALYGTKFDINAMDPSLHSKSVDLTHEMPRFGIEIKTQQDIFYGQYKDDEKFDLLCDKAEKLERKINEAIDTLYTKYKSQITEGKPADHLRNAVIELCMTRIRVIDEIRTFVSDYYQGPSDLRQSMLNNLDRKEDDTKILSRSLSVRHSEVLSQFKGYDADEDKKPSQR